LAVEWHEVTVALIFGVVSVILTYPSREGYIDRRRGFILLALYIVYLTVIIQNYVA
jgi:Ca2+/Na+ antiporter